jgi:CRISPR-associated protein Cas2
MYVVCTYDVAETRCDKYKKLLRKYLFHVQKSVFEGELTPRTFNELYDQIRELAFENDHIRFYFCYNNKQLYKQVIGKEDSLTIIN